MKVDIKHVEKSQGLVFKKKFYGVALTIVFNEEEKAIIEERDLRKYSVVERDTPADVDEEKHEKRGLMKKLATAVVSGSDANHFHLTLNKLMNGTDTYYFETPLEAKSYEVELKEALPILKDNIMANASTEDAGSTFEL